MAKKTNGKTRAKKLNRRKDTIKDLDARAKGRSVRGGRDPKPISSPIPIPYPNTG